MLLTTETLVVEKPAEAEHSHANGGHSHGGHGHSHGPSFRASMQRRSAPQLVLRGRTVRRNPAIELLTGRPPAAGRSSFAKRVCG